ncbi:MAG: WD40 repeat domain-containing serine/threonine-protein kinase [Thermoanaerobaculia bacterium]|nr:WD40 repeat domain-containing serine/threonine-protein kinase [Thermoanaerobaculia bacterium]
MARSRAARCPDCGTPLSAAAWAEGLCLPCLAELAVADSLAEAQIEGALHEGRTLESDGATGSAGGAGSEGAPGWAGGVSPGAVLGERYRLRSHLGSGGMGEVWRAFDLKLRVDVALKSLRSELIRDAEALEMLRQEVRLAREVISPNVCRVFDLQEVGDQEWISMEYVDGTTLQEIVRERGPLALDEAREIASQFLAGLGAIHEAGLVHRDVKPENLMVTRAGRVVVMDFGIAKSLEEGAGGVVSGTPAYMSPEQARGEALDARADVFAAGVVLAEMVAPSGAATLEQRRSIWEGIHAPEPRVAETPWAGLIGQAVASRREERPASAAVLARALEEVTLRAAGDEDVDPYPGLSAFTEERAEYFFGRELEVEGLWKRLRRPQLRALIAPSGAGKSSFLRAGVLATLPEGWRAIAATPGRRPFAALASALAGGGAKVVPDSPSPEAALASIAAWRGEGGHALVIVDQFEELFTQNDEETQAAFSDLLGRLPLDADVHVLLAMREDFHFHCQRFEALAPVFSETMPLGPLGGSALRRALVQPALKCGYRFEDDSLVDEMLAEVAHERGALPLLAFAARQLWERRDREKGLLTRAAYEEIGGVGGALGRHAEATLERIGSKREPMVRELFRNLVTAQGTRVARGREELLSVFDAGERAAAGEVLDALVDARLLTSYDEAGGERSGATRLEVVHESLLAKWPRLVRWRTQDAEGAQLRDDLRQSAQRWRERGKPDDLLWTGTSFREYELWRERYPGGLTAEEQEFARAMKSRAERRKRQRRTAVGAAFAVLLAVLGVVGFLWVQSETARQRAETEALRAEAQKLLALGRLELDGYPAAGLAYARKSLELADSPEARRMALEALWRAPPVRVVDQVGGNSAYAFAGFSPDGRWLLGSTGPPENRLKLVTPDGGSHVVEEAVAPPGAALAEWADPQGGYFVLASGNPAAGPGAGLEISLWSTERLARVAEMSGVWPVRVAWDARGRLLAQLATPAGGCVVEALGTDGQRSRLGPLDQHPATAWNLSTIPRSTGGWVGVLAEGDVLVSEIGETQLGEWRWVGRHAGATLIRADPGGKRLATRGDDGRIVIWDPRSGARVSEVRGPVGSEEYFHTVGFPAVEPIQFSPGGRWLHAIRMFEGAKEAEVHTWSLEAEPPAAVSRIDLRDTGATLASHPGRGLIGRSSWTGVSHLFRATSADAEPIRLLRGEAVQALRLNLHPEGRWAAVSDLKGASIWSLDAPLPIVIRKRLQHSVGLAFAEDGGSLFAAWGPEVWRWELEEETLGPGRRVYQDPGDLFFGVAVSPSGADLLLGSEPLGQSGGPHLVSLENGEVENLPDGFPDQARGITFRRDGELMAAANETRGVVRIWDRRSRQVLHQLAVEKPGPDLAFLPDGELLYVDREEGLKVWVPGSEATTLLLEAEDLNRFGVSRDGRRILVLEMLSGGSGGRMPILLDRESGAVTRLVSHGAETVVRSAFDPEGRFVVTGHFDGSVKVGPVTGEEPHLLLGHEAHVRDLAVDPLGRWIASSGQDGTVRLWPVPDMNQRPLHLLPLPDLLASLDSATNLRLVEDDASPTGWRLEAGPFPGWDEWPSW